MIRAWRNELLCLTAIVLASQLVGLVVREPLALLAVVSLGYLAWHFLNFTILQLWIGRRRSFRLPHSLGVWEAIFDGLQRRELRHRRRARRFVASLSDIRHAAAILPDALAILSESGKIGWVNPAAQKLLNLRWPNDLGKHIGHVIVHPVFEDDLAENRLSRPLEVPSPANGAWMLSIQVTAPFGTQRERLLVARDVTAVFRLEQARRDFLASVSHELRTPITVFRGYLEALGEIATGSPQWRKPFAHMDQQARRMQALVDDLLTLSRLEMADRPQAEEPLPVAEILDEIVDEARVLSGDRKHDLRLVADPEVWLFGEEAELHSAFSNLIFNAVRHTPPHTRVDVHWQVNVDGALFSVRDRGSGIAAYHLPRLTERFYRVDAGRSRRSGGSGLGLAIVKQVLERYSAELRIASTVGEGTTFSCHFPAALVAMDPLAAVDPPDALSKAV